MKVKAWMTRDVECVKPRDSILHARQVMVEHRINQLPVIVDGKLVGIITDRDIRDALPSALLPEWPSRRGTARRKGPDPDPKNVSVEMVMTPNVLTLGSEEPIAAAARLMLRERIGALPIVDDDQLKGILARSDILRALVALEELR